MVRQGAMTGFASHTYVLPLALRLGNVGVAGLAGFVSGEPGWTSPDIIHGGWAKMPVLAEPWRDYRRPNDQERGYSYS